MLRVTFKVEFDYDTLKRADGDALEYVRNCFEGFKEAAKTHNNCFSNILPELSWVTKET